MQAKIPLLVTTEYRGVFFGYGVPTNDTIIRLENAQMAIYWSSDIKGVLGLASTGPSEGCRIGPKVPALTLQKVTSITECSKKAEALWLSQPCS